MRRVKLEVTLADNEYKGDDLDYVRSEQRYRFGYYYGLIKEENKMKKCIVTVLGKDTVGIVAKVMYISCGE